MREIIKTFKVLSDETRLRALNLVLEQECCVCEIMRALNISQSKASRDLTALYDAGFLKMRKEGLWSYYSLDTEEMTEYYTGLLEVIKKALQNDKITLEDKERLKSAKRTGVSCIKCNSEA
jgi:ArsR family transcriptional regulator, arsenate/arsenite/antimonite-responsive transcriptional repressor